MVDGADSSTAAGAVPSPVEPLDIDEEWLLSQPREELETLCEELGIPCEGTTEQIASSIVDALEERQDLLDDEDEGAGEGEDGEGEDGEDEEEEQQRGAMVPHDDGSEPDDDEVDDEARREKLERLRREREAGPRRPAGSIQNDELRASLSFEGRRDLAVELKARANALFASGTTDVALGAYLAAIWLLKPNDPPCPNSLASAIWLVRPDDPLRPTDVEGKPPPVGGEGALLLGEGRPPLGTRRREAAKCLIDAECAALRESLHLNVAAAAVKESDWELAQQACNHVLRRDPANPKGLYRRAQAHAGAGELKASSKALVELLGIDGQQGNRAARELLADVRRRSEERRTTQTQAHTREKIERSLKDAAAAEDASVEAERRSADLVEQRKAAAVRVREPPAVGARVSIYWPGDEKWEEGEVVEEIKPDASQADVPRLQHKVRYDDGFEHVHDLCSSHRHAFEYKLVKGAPSLAMRAATRAGKSASWALSKVGGPPSLASVTSVIFGLFALAPAVAVIVGMAYAEPKGGT